MNDDFCAGCAIECLCDTSKYEAMSDAELDAVAALDVNLANDASIDRGRHEGMNEGVFHV